MTYFAQLIIVQQGGGGHPQVGTCQIPLERSDSILKELIAVIEDMNK
mgnify:CR=1 FL=1